jgi:ADP-dependent NAD(P)H-hydrate dehydratase
MAATSSAVAIDDALLRDWPLPQPAGAADKDERGSMLVIAGSAETPGAALLAATAALRAGAGKLAVATVASTASALALSLPESRVIALAETLGGGPAADSLARLETLLERVDGILVGPGLQDATATRTFARRIFKRETHARIVIDALAMEMVLDVGRLHRTALMTPHHGEMAHLTGLTKEAIAAEPERHAREAAARWNAVVVLKGALTVIAAPGGACWRHDSGQPGLGTSGSGDVLAGIIAGIAARGAPLVQAAAWGVALHARAGQKLSERFGPIGYLASELPAEIPRLMQQLADGSSPPG